jgi:hypothetical protein
MLNEGEINNENKIPIQVEMNLLSNIKEKARQEIIKQNDIKNNFTNQLYYMIKDNQNMPEQKTCSHVVYDNIKDITYCHFCYKIDDGKSFY